MTSHAGKPAILYSTYGMPTKPKIHGPGGRLGIAKVANKPKRKI